MIPRAIESSALCAFLLLFKCACQQAQLHQLNSHAGSFLANCYNNRSSHRCGKWSANMVTIDSSKFCIKIILLLLFKCLVK